MTIKKERKKKNNNRINILTFGQEFYNSCPKLLYIIYKIINFKIF